MNFNQRLKIAPAVNRALFRVGSRMAFIPRVGVECHSQGRGPGQGLSQAHRAALAMVCPSGFKLSNSNRHVVQNSRSSAWSNVLPKIPKRAGVTRAALESETQRADRAEGVGAFRFESSLGTVVVLVGSLRSQATKSLTRYYRRAREARRQEG